MYKLFKFLVLSSAVLTCIHSIGASSFNSPVKILNWWNYLPEKTIEVMQKKEYSINLEVYKSNNFAVSQLINHPKKFDVVIVSNQIID